MITFGASILVQTRLKKTSGIPLFLGFDKAYIDYVRVFKMD